jgi:predicted amidohydrolase
MKGLTSTGIPHRGIRLGLVQMRCEKGAIDQNLERIAEYVRDAREQGVDILVFPEMSITGYIDPTRRPEAVITLDGPEVARFLALTAGTDMTVIAGLVERNPAGKPFITQIVARAGRLLDFYRKRTIKDDEELWFSPGLSATICRHGETAFGLAVCADIDNAGLFAELAGSGARLVLHPAAPGLYGDMATRNWQSGFEWWRQGCAEKLGGYAREHGMWVAVATQAGRTVDEDFPGGGYVFDPDGVCVAATPDWSEGILYADVCGRDWG